MNQANIDELVTLIVSILAVLYALLKQHQNNKLEKEVDRLTRDRRIIDEEGNFVDGEEK